MKIGFYTACFPELTLTEITNFAAGEGFKTLEVACWPKGSADRKGGGVCHIDVETFNQNMANEIKQNLKEKGLGISTLSYYANNLDPNPETRKAHHSHLKKVIAAASMLEVPMVGTFAGKDPSLSLPENLKEFQDVFLELLEYARPHQVKLIIENCPAYSSSPTGQNLAHSPEMWEQMFVLIPDENLGLNFDPSHLFWQGIDIFKAIHNFSSRIMQVHAKDVEILTDVLGRVGLYGKGWWRNRLPGLGEIKWGRLLSALYEVGYEGPVCLEQEDPIWEKTTEKAKKGLLLGKRHLEKFMI